MKKLEIEFPALLFTPSLMLLCGAKGAGKSTLACNLLLTTYKNQFKTITFVSPTFEAQLPILWGKLDPEGIFVYESLTQEFVENYLKTAVLSTGHNLLILDDCANQQRQIKGDSWNKLVSNSRHYNLSIWCLNQSIIQSETITRQNADVIIAWPSCSFRERECLYQSRSSVDRKSFLQLFQTATDKPRSFLVSTVKAGKLKFFMNDFKTEINT